MTEWRTIKIEHEAGEGVSVNEFSWNAYDAIWIKMDNGMVFVSRDQGVTWEGVNVSWYRTVTWGWRLKSWWWRSWMFRAVVRLRYVFTGDCGHNCHIGSVAQCAETPGQPDWLSVSWTEYRLIPEADCPVHDNDIMNREEE